MAKNSDKNNIEEEIIEKEELLDLDIEEDIDEKALENAKEAYEKRIKIPFDMQKKIGIKILKELGVVGFVSTKKGTNSMKPNWNMIRRIELRKYTPEKFKINLLVARNLILGKIYGWVS